MKRLIEKDNERGIPVQCGKRVLYSFGSWRSVRFPSPTDGSTLIYRHAGDSLVGELNENRNAEFRTHPRTVRIAGPGRPAHGSPDIPITVISHRDSLPGEDL